MINIFADTFRSATRLDDDFREAPGDWRPPTYWQRKPFETKAPGRGRREERSR